LQNDKVRVKAIYLRSIAMIALVTFPLMLGLLVVADHFVLAIFGPVWAGVIPILRVFCILGMTQSIYSTIGWIFQSQGRTDWMLRWGAFSAVVSIAGIGLGVWLGSPLAIAICLALIGILLLPPGFDIPGKLIGITARDVTDSILGITGCAATMAVCVWILRMLLPHNWSNWQHLSVEVLFGGAIYLALAHLLQLAAYRELRDILVRQVEASFGPSVLSSALRG